MEGATRQFKFGVFGNDTIGIMMGEREDSHTQAGVKCKRVPQLV